MSISANTFLDYIISNFLKPLILINFFAHFKLNIFQEICSVVKQVNWTSFSYFILFLVIPEEINLALQEDLSSRSQSISSAEDEVKKSGGFNYKDVAPDK